MLDGKYRDHSLTGEWRGYRDCRVWPDLVPIYSKPDPKVLWLVHPAPTASFSTNSRLSGRLRIQCSLRRSRIGATAGAAVGRRPTGGTGPEWWPTMCQP